MGDHDYGTHDPNVCGECLGFAVGSRHALLDAADAMEAEAGTRSKVEAAWLRARAEEVGQ